MSMCSWIAIKLCLLLAPHLANYQSAAFSPFSVPFYALSFRAALVECKPNDKPITTTAASAAVFANVNVFWTIFPTSRPRVFVHVSSAINAIATSCSIDKLIAYPPKEIGATR